MAAAAFVMFCLQSVECDLWSFLLQMTGRVKVKCGSTYRCHPAECSLVSDPWRRNTAFHSVHPGRHRRDCKATVETLTDIISTSGGGESNRSRPLQRRTAPGLYPGRAVPCYICDTSSPRRSSWSAPCRGSVWSRMRTPDSPKGRTRRSVNEVYIS